MTKQNKPEMLFYEFCHKPKPLKQISSKTFSDKPLCKKRARG